MPAVTDPDETLPPDSSGPRDSNDTPTAPLPSGGGDLGAGPRSDVDASAFREYMADDGAKGANPWDEAAGDRIDQYELVEEVGRGTFGAVWRAHDTELRRDVAIKLVRPGMDAREFLARFRQEQRVLAALSHPNIATLYGGGISAKGRPYFAMEYIEGASITRFCDRERLDIRQRLRVFLDVCRAVQFAHTNNIAHRDLKPGNVLVAYTQTRAIRAVVIDFGLAKALSPGAFGGGGVHSAQLLVVGTPEYMSPEQASPYGQGIDNRTDVYALGVMLYELLAGAKPFDFSGISSSENWSEVQRILRDIDPPAPSSKLSTIASSDAKRADEIASARRERYETLAGTLSRELQWIPLKAMKKERGERYGTVQELADDIQRYLDGMPIKAAPDSPAYRARKFVRRNRVSLSIAAAVVVLAGASIALGVAGRIREIENEALVKRNALLASQRDMLRSLAASDFEEMALAAAAAGRQFDRFDAARRTAEAWRRFADRPVPEEDDAVGRADLAADLLSLGQAALQASRTASSNRLNTTGLGDAEAGRRWFAIADDARARLQELAPGSQESIALSVMCARTALDAIAEKRDYAGTIVEGERILRELASQVTDPGSAATRDLGLVKSQLADAYQSLAQERLKQTAPDLAELSRFLARALELRNGEAERRRGLVSASRGELLVAARKDLAVMIERLAWIYADSVFAPLRGAESARSAQVAAATLREEYFSRFIEPMKPGDDPGEMQEYAGALIRFADFEFDAACRSLAREPDALAKAKARYMAAIEEAIEVYLETLWRDSGNLRSYQMLVQVSQRGLTQRSGLDSAWQDRMLARIERAVVGPQRELNLDAIAKPQVRDAMLALRMAVDARRAVVWRPTDRARPFAEGAYSEATREMARIASSTDPQPSAALLAEIELAVALARQFSLAGVEEAERSLASLKSRPDLQNAFKDRPSVLFQWYEEELAACSQSLPEAGD